LPACAKSAALQPALKRALDVAKAMNFDFGLRKFYRYKGPSIYETPFIT